MCKYYIRMKTNLKINSNQNLSLLQIGINIYNFDNMKFFSITSYIGFSVMFITKSYVIN